MFFSVNLEVSCSWSNQARKGLTVAGILIVVVVQHLKVFSAGGLLGVPTPPPSRM